MYMIWHYAIIIHTYAIVVFVNKLYTFFDRLTDRRQYISFRTRRAANLGKQFFFEIGANCNKIATVLAVIVVFQAYVFSVFHGNNDTSVLFAGVEARHYAVFARAPPSRLSACHLPTSGAVEKCVFLRGGSELPPYNSGIQRVCAMEPLPTA